MLFKVTKISEKGTYKIIYKLFDEDGTTQLKDEEGTDVTLTRTVKIIDFDLIKSQTLKTNTLYYSTKDEFDYPSAELSGKTIKCSPDNNCLATYYLDDTLSTPVSVDSTNPGVYYVKYDLTDENGFELSLVNTIVFQAVYELKIEGIKSDGQLNLYGDDFIVLGAYYVNVQSPRTNDSETDILLGK